MDNALEQLGHLCFSIKDYFWRQNENSSLTYTVKKRWSLLFEWSRPTSFLLDQNIFLILVLISHFYRINRIVTQRKATQRMSEPVSIAIGIGWGEINQTDRFL